MAYDPGALRIALAVAVGDDVALVAELRGAFVESAAAMADVMARSRDDDAWRAAAWRLHGLSASFGAVDLMALAGEAARGDVGDPAGLRRIDEAIAVFQG